MRSLREGEVMGLYMEFDRTANKEWTSAEYLVQFGLFVSQATIKENTVVDVNKELTVSEVCQTIRAIGPFPTSYKIPPYKEETHQVLVQAKDGRVRAAGSVYGDIQCPECDNTIAFEGTTLSIGEHCWSCGTSIHSFYPLCLPPFKTM